MFDMSSFSKNQWNSSVVIHVGKYSVSWGSRKEGGGGKRKTLFDSEKKSTYWNRRRQLKLFFSFTLYLPGEEEEVDLDSANVSMGRRIDSRVHLVRLFSNQMKSMFTLARPQCSVSGRALSPSIEEEERGARRDREKMLVCTLDAWTTKKERRRRRRSQGRSISLLAQIQTNEQFIPDCFFPLSRSLSLCVLSSILSILVIRIYG